MHRLTIRLSSLTATPITTEADMSIDWLYSDKLADGHRLFYTANPKQIAIADDSGNNPEQTDDGVLWLDFTQPLGCKSAVEDDKTQWYSRTLCRIPVINFSHTKSYVISDAPTVIFLSATYGWPINVHGTLYKAKLA